MTTPAGTSPGASPHIAVVIPCFNDAEFLRPLLQRLQEQTHPAETIVVVDNNCTDDSATVAATTPGVHLVREPRQGIPYAAAAGYDAAAASGADLIVRLDADSLPPTDYLEQICATWRKINHDAPTAPRRVVALTGNARFTNAGASTPVMRLISKLYLGAYHLSTSSALGHAPLFGTNCAILASWWRAHRTHLHKADAKVHDDLHLSFAVQPDETVWYQQDLFVEMDGRALRGFRQLCTRFSRGMHTMLVNFRTQPPPRRLAQRGLLAAVKG